VARVLLVEDDASLGRTLMERLEREKIEVTWVQTVAAGEAALAGGPWSLAIVDVKLPDGSGFGLARRIKRDSLIPVMFMTALNSAENRLEGFEIGADEYLPKPFHLKEFILRVRHVLSTERVSEVIHASGRQIDLGALAVLLPDGTRTFLQVRDAKVLKLLVASAPNVVERAEVIERVWEREQTPTARAVDNCIVRLRQALRDDQGELIRSVRGVGYQWTPGATSASPPARVSS
jgi:two-component system, OmpR family, phosphate regulon response regulator PhoB